MTNSVAASIRAGLLIGIFAAGADPAQAQNLTFFREYPQPGGGMGSTGFVSDGRGALSALIGDTLRKYDSGGSELWTKQIGIVPSLGTVLGLAANASGVFVAGLTFSGSVLPGQTGIGKADAFVRRYDSDGRELWTRQFGTPENEGVQVVAADATGVYVAGNTFFTGSPTLPIEFVSRFDASGNQLWTSHFTGAATLVNASADSAGVYITSGHGEPPIVRRFDARGNAVWTRQLDPSNGLRALVAADETGAYVWFGNASLLRRYDQAGSESWTRQVQNGRFSTVGVSGLAADSTGVFVLGGAGGAIPGQCYAGSFDFFLTRYTSGGNETWTRQFGTAWVDNTVGVGVDSTGAYVYGYHQPNLGPDGSPPPPGTFLANFEKSSPPVTDSQPRILWDCVLNAANYLGGAASRPEKS